MSNYKNLASTVLGNSGQTTDTSIVIPSTTAAIFPTPPFYATIMPTNVGLVNSSNSEIVEVTASNTSGSDTTFTVSRAQRGTSAISWNAHEAILSHAIYTQDMPFIDSTLSTPSSVAYVATDNIQTSAVTTPKIADGAVTSDKIDSATYTLNEEIVVGNWLGAPLYRKTILISTPNNASGGVNLSQNQYLGSKVIKFEPSMTSSSNYTFQDGYYENNAAAISLTVSPTAVYFGAVASSYRNMDCYITAYYIK